MNTNLFRWSLAFVTTGIFSIFAVAQSCNRVRVRRLSRWTEWQHSELSEELCKFVEASQNLASCQK